MNKILEMLLIGAVSARVPAVGKIYQNYNRYAVPLIRAERFYKRYKKQGMDTKDALMRAAYDADVPLHLLTDLISKKSGDVGKVAIDSILGGTAYNAANTSYKKSWER